ncbi:hypothetical protein [Carnobacterium maltaromaticum]|uniref:hypothetical protein n=1 Tax=Carnobacterium maltaromaticum TaxID=2751 RepID=UPI00165BBB47|nr:hypothetical protein [Carnobacterium maltaromaticum]MBC9808173.1 hypothetical protein [Carnobacterium maltaromaticum]
MSFVSIVGNKNYISVVCDGLAVYEDGTRNEDYQKFEILQHKYFIAFAGTIEACVLCQEEMKRLLLAESPIYDDIYDEMKNFTKKINFSEINKAQICIGSNDNGTLRLSAFSNNPEIEATDFKLTSKDIRATFLNNYSGEIPIEDLFFKYAKRYKSVSQNQIFLAQRDLNEYVADINPNEVNKNIKRFTLKK